jgi:hypothetical protein
MKSEQLKASRMTSKKGQKLTLSVLSKVKDVFGLWEVDVKINSKVYTYQISSEYLLRKVDSLIYRHKPGRALYLLKIANVTVKQEE